MDKLNPDGSKKRKRKEEEDDEEEKRDDLQGLNKRSRDEENKRGEGEESGDMAAQLSFSDLSPSPGCSYNIRPHQENLQIGTTYMEWRQGNESEEEEEFRIDSGLNDEHDEETGECSATCNLTETERITYGLEDGCWEDDFIQDFAAISVQEPSCGTTEPKFGPEINLIYNAETAIEEGWDWPYPDEGKSAETVEPENAQEPILPEWVVEEEQFAEAVGEEVMNSEDDPR